MVIGRKPSYSRSLLYSDHDGIDKCEQYQYIGTSPERGVSHPLRNGATWYRTHVRNELGNSLFSSRLGIAHEYLLGNFAEAQSFWREGADSRLSKQPIQSNRLLPHAETLSEHFGRASIPMSIDE